MSAARCQKGFICNGDRRNNVFFSKPALIGPDNLYTREKCELQTSTVPGHNVGGLTGRAAEASCDGIDSSYFGAPTPAFAATYAWRYCANAFDNGPRLPGWFETLRPSTYETGRKSRVLELMKT